MKIISLLSSIILVLVLAFSASARDNTFHWDTTFLDFEDIMTGKKNKQTVHMINHEGAPITIESASVSDRGTKGFAELKDAVNDFVVNVHNNSGRNVLSYQVAWTMKFPFEDYIVKKIKANSIELLKSGDEQELEFRRDKFFRDDVYYFVEISKVEFDDDRSIWEAPLSDETSTEYEKIQKELHELEEMGIDLSDKEEDIDVDALKDKFGTVTDPKTKESTVDTKSGAVESKPK